ncbi:unnamed protein product [Durusdinium trenchii]|uniref:Uncharacterized protein n=1 Tax=Durusdinium trenchii TaxID=1381693 RepID=A0ABP0JV18_9DINO
MYSFQEASRSKKLHNGRLPSAVEQEENGGVLGVHSGFKASLQHQMSPPFQLRRFVQEIPLAGCVIYMLYFGKRPFSVHESAEHLAMMERLTESCFPPWMLQTAQECQDDEASYELLITEDKKLVWPEGPAGARVEALRPLSAQVLPRHKTFLSFLKGLFQLEPLQRLRATQAHQMEFLTTEVQE